MKHRHARALSVLLGAFALILAISPPAAAQVPSRPLFLALPEIFPELDAQVLVMREPGRDIVILRQEGADPEALEVALGVLARVQRERPLQEDRGQLIPITGFAYTRGMTAERREALDGVLEELKGRPLAKVGNLGLGRWMQYLPR